MKNTKKNMSKYWRLACIAVVLLVVITFTPLIVPHGVYTPEILGLPYTLWTGILIAMLLVMLTFIGSWVYPAKEEGNEK
jgi:membrane protease YdiL (CAAX protease family)